VRSDGLAEVLAPIREDPARAGVFSDFDGTLSGIVDDPAAARPLDGVADTLTGLAGRYRTVAVVSGRPVAFLQQFLPSSVTLAGLYGLELVEEGERREHPRAGQWRAVIDDVVARSRAAGPVGMLVEPKGLSLTLHFREHPDLEWAVRQWAESEAARSGLGCRPARRSLELHPPLPVDKGTTVRELASGLEAVVFLGDDQGDLPAFDALAALKGEGIRAVRVAVASSEAPASLLDQADIVVAGPAGALDLLQQL
jgi:trehalose 6-phosphate phosphatase